MFMPQTKYSILDFARDVLQSTSFPLTYQEIWEKGKELGLTNKLLLTGKTPWRSLGSRLFIDVRDNPETVFFKASKNPARFFLKNRESELRTSGFQQLAVIPEVVASTKKAKDADVFHERKLHPVLAYYAYANPDFNHGKQIYTKTIFHEKSKHKTLNKWIHPDMVGFYSPVDDWNGKLLDFNNVTSKTAIRLYSFEIKRSIDRTNYRENFFQAVSNSSWANEGYLVTCSVQQDDDLLSELERLSASFGIGIIVLDLDDIDSSSILFAAKAKDELDWQTMNKLCEQNKDFETFIGDIQTDFVGKKIHPNEYDRIPSDIDEYVRELNSKK